VSMSARLPTIDGRDPGRPGIRPCCILTASLPLIGDNLFDQSTSRLEHRYGTGIWGYITKREHSGIVYSRAMGFIDIGHVRDLADLTLHYYLQLCRGHARGDAFRPFFYDGRIEILKPIPAEHLLAVARSLAYDQSAFHEIYTYWQPWLSGHHSAFSPEDMVSNLLGTYVGEQAIVAGGDFNRAVTDALGVLLPGLGALPRAGTAAALEQITGRWIEGRFSELMYVRRRNFGIRPIDPWLVPGLDDGGRATLPADLSPEPPPGAGEYYLATYAVPRAARRGMQVDTVRHTEFGADGPLVARIKADAARPVRYGPTFDVR
jgi:Protein of unknown function (DUF4056)